MDLENYLQGKQRISPLQHLNQYIIQHAEYHTLKRIHHNIQMQIIFCSLQFAQILRANVNGCMLSAVCKFVATSNTQPAAGHPSIFPLGENSRDKRCCLKKFNIYSYFSGVACGVVAKYHTRQISHAEYTQNTEYHTLKRIINISQ